ncbi:MAG TPA: GAF domain-containing protein, partial [Vicinamibacteria bacterium]|nr:GAF domain-containing protein [Vicinamibacteria bacterium]
MAVPAIPQPEAAVARLQARVREQSALAELGRIAIGFRGLGALLREAAQLSAATIDADLAAIEERLSDGRLRLAAGTGFGEGSVGRVGADDPFSLTAFVLAATDPVVVPNVRTDPRFTVPEDVLASGMVSAVAVPIRGAAGSWGALTVYSIRPRTFTPDEVAFLHSVGSLLAQV